MRNLILPFQFVCSPVFFSPSKCSSSDDECLPTDFVFITDCGKWLKQDISGTSQIYIFHFILQQNLNCSSSHLKTQTSGLLPRSLGNVWGWFRKSEEGEKKKKRENVLNVKIGLWQKEARGLSPDLTCARSKRGASTTPAPAAPSIM